MAAMFEIEGRESSVAIRARRPDLMLEIDRKLALVAELAAPPGAFAVTINGRVTQGWRYVKGDEVYLRFNGRTVHLRQSSQLGDGADAAQAPNEILSEMPGTVIAVHVAPGSDVEEGERLLTIESMKLQLTIAAPRSGRIASIHVVENASFDRGVPLVSFAPPPADAAGE